MRHSSIRTVSLFAIALAGSGVVAAYVRSEGVAPPQTLAAQGIITPRTRALIRKGTAYMVGAPEVVSDMTDIQQVSVSPDKGAVLVCGYRSRPYQNTTVSPADYLSQLPERSPELNLSYWDTRTRMTQTLMREKVKEGVQPNVYMMGVSAHVSGWFPQTRVAMVQVVRNIDEKWIGTLYRVNTMTGTITRLTELDGLDTFEISPKEQLAFLYTKPIKGANGQPDTPPTIRVYTQQSSRPPIRLTQEMDRPQWTPDGKAIYSAKRSVSMVDGKRTVHVTYDQINLETGEITHPEKVAMVPRSQTDTSESTDWPVEYTTSKLSVQDPNGGTQSISGLWLQASGTLSPDASITPTQSATPVRTQTPVAGQGSGKDSSDLLSTNTLLIATNAEPSALMTGTKTAAVLFRRDGILCASPIFRIPVEEFTRTLRKVQRDTTMQNAKQVGLGMIMYAMDFDENFPLPDSPVSDTVSPYLKNKSAFENPANGVFGFTYSLKGNLSLSGIPAPATTELGYLNGVGGRAVLWTDGHVTWQDEP